MFCKIECDHFYFDCHLLTCRGVLSAPQRRIAYDTAGKFVELQKELLRGGHTAGDQSQQQWAAVLAFSNAVSTILETSDEAEPTPEEVQASQERALWDLISLFALDPRTASASGIPDLPKWLRSNAAALAGSPSSTPLPRTLSANLQQMALPEAHPEYWPMLQRLVALGWVADALEVMGLHSAWLQWGTAGENPEIDAQVAVLEAATLLLRRMPSVRGRGASGGGTTREFDTLEECLTYRTAWQHQCRTLLDEGKLWDDCAAVAPETATAVHQIVQILCGDEAAVSTATKTWAELLVARLLHIHPDIKNLAELRQLLHACIVERKPASEFHHVTAAVLDACCEGDPQTALRACSVITSDWMLAHVPTVLAAHPAGANLLGQELGHLGATQIEFYLLDYVSALAPHATTWPLATSYLTWCESYGQAGFQAVIERLPLDGADPSIAFKAAEACVDQGLTELAASVERVQGARAWQRGLLGAAVTWLTQGNDIERLDAVLKPLASQVWSLNASTAMQTVSAMKESIEAVPPGSAHHAMVRVKTLLQGKNDIDGAVELLRQLPRGQLQKCLGDVLKTLPTADASRISSEAVMQLLEWLEAYGGGVTEMAVTRLALVRLLVATHARANHRET